MPTAPSSSGRRRKPRGYAPALCRRPPHRPTSLPSTHPSPCVRWCADLPLLQRWPASPHVHRWWFHETTDEALERDVGAGLREEEPGEDLVAELGGVPVGPGPTRPLGGPPRRRRAGPWADRPPAGRARDRPPIGPVELIGHGLGPRIIAAAVAEGRERYPDATAVVVPVARPG